MCPKSVSPLIFMSPFPIELKSFEKPPGQWDRGVMTRWQKWPPALEGLEKARS